VAWIEDCATVLEQAGVASRFSVPRTIFIGSRVNIVVSGEEAILSLVETGGIAPERTQNLTTLPAYEHPAAQVVARANKYAVARDLASKAYYALGAVRNTFINSGWYRDIKPLQEPLDLGLDYEGRARVAFNVMGAKRPS
jgi:hypothetical protein